MGVPCLWVPPLLVLAWVPIHLHTITQAPHLQALCVEGVVAGAVAEADHFGHVEEWLTFQSLGTAQLQHAPANGAGAQVDELWGQEWGRVV